jgi:hypothetical protein
MEEVRKGMWFTSELLSELEVEGIDPLDYEPEGTIPSKRGLSDEDAPF